MDQHDFANFLSGAPVVLLIWILLPCHMSTRNAGKGSSLNEQPHWLILERGVQNRLEVLGCEEPDGAGSELKLSLSHLSRPQISISENKCVCLISVAFNL